jgi:hypothetical protein
MNFVVPRARERNPPIVAVHPRHRRTNGGQAPTATAHVTAVLSDPASGLRARRCGVRVSERRRLCPAGRGHEDSVPRLIQRRG